MKKLICFGTLIALVLQVAYAQKSSPRKQDWPLVITVFSEAWAIPSTALLRKPIHPGISLGTAYTLRRRERSSVTLNGTIGYFYHRNFQHNIHLITSVGYERRLLAGLQVGTALGLGYSHSFYPIQAYAFKNGEYVKIADWGKPAIMPSLTLQLGYTFRRREQNAFTVFTRYQFMAEWPYAPENMFPVLPHTLLHAGLQFTPFTSR